MKNLKKVSEQSKNIVTRDRSTWLPLFYSYEEDAVYTTPSVGLFNTRFHVTNLINPNTPKDIEDAVNRFIASEV